MAELSGVSSRALAAGLMARGERGLVTSEGRLSPQFFELAGMLFPRFCVDGAPARKDSNGSVELMAIRRNTGSQAGKFCLVGGGVERIWDGGNER